MSLWVAVHGLADGQSVKADTFNRPYFELTERTNYLYARLQELIGSSMFESVRVQNAALQTVGDLAPVVGDVVCLDPNTKVYVKAQASMSLLDAFTAALSSYAIGILVSKVGSSGTVLLYGKLTLATSGSAWLVASLVESGEVFRNGPYYLSSVEAGKITAYPSGPKIYVGFYTCDEDATTYGDYALINPQHRDTGESHVHRSYGLYTQPSCRSVLTEADPDGVHYVVGFSPVAADYGSLDPTDRTPRLLVVGSWTGSSATQYTVWLSTAAGTDKDTSPPPTDFSDAYIHWRSSDPTEGDGGIGKARVWSFETLVAIGSKGLYGVLENPTGNTPAEGDDWGTIYSGVGDTAGTPLPDKRTWVFMAPSEVRGWAARYYRQYFTGDVAVDDKYSLLALAGPHTSADNRMSDTITVRCAELYQLDMTVPTDHETTVINGTTYEYTNDGTVADPSYVPVLTDNSADVVYIYQALMTAILTNNESIAEADAVYPAMDEDELIVIIGAPAGSTVTHLGSPVAMAAAGSGVLTEGGGTATFMVYDQDYRNLVTNYGTLYWNVAEFWQSVSLKNGLYVLPIPFSSTGAAHTGDTVAIGDVWTCDIVDHAPGAAFVYAMGMHAALAQYYPPVPAQAASLVLNGIEMDSGSFFSTSTFSIGPDSIYWYPSAWESVPWPRDWVSIYDPGSEQYQQRMVFHFVRSTIGNTGYVTSLQPAPGSPIRVYQCGTTDDATVGDLSLALDLNLKIQDTGRSGYQVVKWTDGDKLQRGPVVEKVIAGRGITITESAGAPAGQGVVTIHTADDTTYSGDFEEVALENAKQEIIGMFPYIRLLDWTTGGTNIGTGFVLKFRVPHTLPADKPYTVTFYATVFGEADIPYDVTPHVKYAGLRFEYSILPDVNTVVANNWMNTSNLLDNLLESPGIDVAIPFGNTGVTPGTELYKAYDPMLVHNTPSLGPDTAGQHAQIFGNPFPTADDFPTIPEATLGVYPGYLVGIRISRTNVADPLNEYTNSIGFINLRWVLTAKG